MSADVLRRAASVLRERAEAASAQSGPTWSLEARYDGAAWLDPSRLPFHGYRSTGAYVATMHPGVGLSMADWLDAFADAGLHLCDCGLADEDPPCFHSTAVAVARAILGEPA